MERRSRIMSSWMFVSLSLSTPFFLSSPSISFLSSFADPAVFRSLCIFEPLSSNDRERRRKKEWDGEKNKWDVEKSETAGKSISWNQFDLEQRLCIRHTKNENEYAPVYRSWIIGESSCRIRNKRPYCGTYLYRPTHKTNQNSHGGES